jgi:ferredoxin
MARLIARLIERPISVLGSQPGIWSAVMKIRIDKAQCVGNARCAATSDQLFMLDDDGYIDSEGFDVPAGEEQAARNGARACPERIIFVIEDDNGTERQVWPPIKV